MLITTQSATTKPSSAQQLTIKPSRLRLMTMLGGLRLGGLGKLGMLGSGVLLGAISLSASASTLISSSDYLDYELPQNIQEQCIERDNCPKIEVKYLKSNHDWINKITNARIDNLVVNSKPSESSPITVKNSGNSKVIKAAIDDFVASQFSDDMPTSSSWSYTLTVKPDYLGHVDNFELFEVNSYVFTGGAHGMPYSEYLIFDPSTKKQVRLEDMLQKGKKSDFESLAYDAYKTWVKTVDQDIIGYEKNWPFTPNDNVTLTDKSINIRYQHYSIGPYAYGMPIISIPYDKLRGIIKPHFSPK
ncbi:RsiV family protein [Psychrobacter sp. 72-O-c]|uniref:RsiV family protein n=1 Tax=Psychrobacter sp. 72-O-c TaxID=2774125 RepID=UPI001D108A5A|nr:RsiV family protein [Psychrobacter sp. 72-O-c]